jgi:hypothetical protein
MRPGTSKNGRADDMLFGGLGMKHSHIFAATSAAAFLCMIPAVAQTAAPRIPRMADGKPNLTGLWQAMGTADWDIEDHSAAAGPFFQLGALGAIPPGQGVVEGGAIPYKPAAMIKFGDLIQSRIGKSANQHIISAALVSCLQIAYRACHTGNLLDE